MSPWVCLPSWVYRKSVGYRNVDKHSALRSLPCRHLLWVRFLEGVGSVPTMPQRALLWGGQHFPNSVPFWHVPAFRKLGGGNCLRKLPCWNGVPFLRSHTFGHCNLLRVRAAVPRRHKVEVPSRMSCRDLLRRHHSHDRRRVPPVPREIRLRTKNDVCRRPWA